MLSLTDKGLGFVVSLHFLFPFWLPSLCWSHKFPEEGMGPIAFLAPLLRIEFLTWWDLCMLTYWLIPADCTVNTAPGTKSIIPSRAKDIAPGCFMIVREKADPWHSADTFQDLHESPMCISMLPSSIKCILNFEKRATRLSWGAPLGAQLSSLTIIKGLASIPAARWVWFKLPTPQTQLSTSPDLQDSSESWNRECQNWECQESTVFNPGYPWFLCQITLSTSLDIKLRN